MLRPLASELSRMQPECAIYNIHLMGDDKPRRNSLRLTGYDYAQSAGYFVTVCTHDQRRHFGNTSGGQMELTPLGLLVDRTWRELPQWFPHVKLDCFVIMPNHVHGILLLLRETGTITESGLKRAKHGFAPTAGVVTHRGTQPASLSAIIQAFKSCITRECNRLCARSEPIWQRGFHDHIIRDEHGLHCIREYVVNNPAQWSIDIENSPRTAINPFYLWLEQQSLTKH